MALAAHFYRFLRRAENWKERWSEIGADHLERAGFKKEADKFRDGHLSRPERARRAYQRGDRAYFEVLLNEPEKHRGPAASRMEREGKRTRQGDNNREIRERNRIRGVPREIREAYYLSVDAAAFLAALEKKHMMVARITEKDAAKKNLEYENSDRYVPRYDVGSYVAVTESGQEYRLGPMTMGDSARGIAEFMDAAAGQKWLPYAALGRNGNPAGFHTFPPAICRSVSLMGQPPMNASPASAVRRGSAKRQRVHKVDTRWDGIEHVSLAAAAQAAGLSKGGYIRALVLGCPGPRSQRAPSINAQALAQATAALGKVASNINQIAKVLNYGGNTVTTCEYLAALREVRVVLASILAAVGREPRP